MQKQINEIEKTWNEILIGLQCADFMGASQRIRRMIYQLKLLKVDINTAADKPYPMIGIGKLSGRGNKGDKNEDQN